MKRNVILVGFMGTGKSSVGKWLANMLCREFIDMDEMIESRAGKSISRIFEEDGENCFRDMERNLVRELARQEEKVIATGGGIVLNEHNISDFSASGLVVCLSGSEPELICRLANADNRPLLADGSIEKKVSELLKNRKKFYDAIPCQVDTSGLTIEDVAMKVLAILREQED